MQCDICAKTVKSYEESKIFTCGHRYHHACMGMNSDKCFLCMYNDHIKKSSIRYKDVAKLLKHIQ